MDAKREIIAHLTELFVHRRDIHSRQTSEGRYYKVDEVIDADLIENHLNGIVTIAPYQVLDGTVKIICFDVDILKSEIKIFRDKGLDNTQIFHNFWPDLKVYGQMIVAELMERGFKEALLVEPSGNRGLHVYLLLNPIKVQTAKALGESILKAVGEPPSGIDVELFPKSAAKGGGPGYALKHPLGVHRVSNKRSFFIDPVTFEDNTGADCDKEQFWVNQLERLNSVVPATIDETQVDNLAETKKEVDTEGIIIPLDNRLLKKASEACSWFNDVLSEAKSNNHISHNDRVAIATNLIQLGDEGITSIHHAIAMCSDYERETTDKNIKYFIEETYKPTGCKKLCPKEQCKAIKKIQGRNPADAIRGVLSKHGSGSEPKTCINNDDSVLDRIQTIRRNRDRKPPLQDFEVNNLVANEILIFLSERGKFFTDGREVYYFDDGEKKLIKINKEDNNFLILLGHLSIYPSEFIHRYVEDYLFLYVLEHGIKTEIYYMSYFDQDTLTVYLSDFNNQVYKINKDTIALVDNGTDGVLFIADPKYQTFIVDIANKPSGISLFEKHIILGINFIEDRLTPDERRVLLRFWFYSIFFESMMPTKSIIAFIGRMGSGKSSALRKFGTLLYGGKFQVMPLTDDSRDFDAAITNSDFVAIDNADSKIKWLDDRLAIAATGGTIKKRELYTTNRLVDFPVRCFIGITSRTPHFRREDVADRLLMMKVERFDKFIPEKDLLKEVLDNRNQIMTEVAYRLQEVIQALHATRDQIFEIDFRMADFAQFALRIARHEGNEDEVHAIFKKLTQEQSIFSLEDDPMLKLLSTWVEANQDKEVTSTELCKELSKIAKIEKINFEFDGQSRSFAQRLPNMIPNLEEFFSISSHTAGGRKKFYKFKLKDEDGVDV